MYAHIPRPKIQPGGEEHLRQVPPVQVPNIEHEPLKFIALALVHLRNEIAKLPVMIADASHPVDEYYVQELAPPTISSITLQPQYETPEIIEAVLITGPAAGTGTLQLGDRLWPFTLPATQVLFIGAPLLVCLSRSDNRVLTVNTPGAYSVELMGHADSRGNLI